MEFVNPILEIFFHIWNFSIDRGPHMVYNVFEVISMLHEILNAQKKKLGLDIDSIVEKSGVPKGTVSKIMAGTTPNPSIENVKAIAYALGLTLSDLDDQMFAKNISDEEQALLSAFRSLDAPGKAAVTAVLESQQQRIKEYGRLEKKPGVNIRMPLIQGTHEADVQMRYQSKREQQELHQSETLQSDPT